MFLFYPKGPCRTAFKRCSITILRDEDDEASVLRLLENGLARLALDYDIILSFPNPKNGRWDYDFTVNTNDLALFPVFQEAAAHEENRPALRHANGIPTYWEMMNAWHPMHDTRYVMGFGSGASMACTLAACSPKHIAAVCSIGGQLCAQALQKAVYAPMPVWLIGSDGETAAYFIKANQAVKTGEGEHYRRFHNLVNPLQSVVEFQDQYTVQTPDIQAVWKELFSRVRRPDTGKNGDCDPRMDFQTAGFETYLDDSRLDEVKKTPHTWFTHVPPSVLHEGKKVPLLIFMHGGSDNPAESAEISKFHELGEQEGFITVYPWATNKAQWNNNLDKDEADDVSFIVALIRYMRASYPVDPERVYLSGFSNGAAQAQVVGMLHPELIAALCPIDTSWPGDTDRFEPNCYADILPMNLAMKKKRQFDYKMPVWYTYGTKEVAYPVWKGRSQQRQYDFWKEYNGIAIQPTPGKEAPHPCGCGVPGETKETIAPSQRHPHHFYEAHRFYTDDNKRQNLYNYVLMHDKGHDVAQMDPALGWRYVRQFRRLPDGGLEWTAPNE